MSACAESSAVLTVSDTTTVDAICLKVHRQGDDMGPSSITDVPDYISEFS